MKNTLVTASLIPVLAFALATAAPIAGLVAFRCLDVAGLIGGIAAAGLLAFAWCDYTRKPTFCGRRIRRTTSPTRPVSHRTPAMAKAAWTYHTISA